MTLGREHLLRDGHHGRRRCRPASRSSTGSATMWGGKIRFETPMLFCLGVPLPVPDRGPDRHHAGAVPFDWQLSDSYFVVAHFHYVLVGGTRLHDLRRASTTGSRRRPAGCSTRRSGSWHFWLFVIGFHLTFDTMHIPGLLGHAAAHLHLRSRAAAGSIWNLIVHGRRGLPGRRPSWSSCGTSSRSLLQGQAGRERPVGRLDAGVGDHLAAARLQLRDDSRRAEPAAALGLQASGGSRTGSTSERTTR